MGHFQAALLTGCLALFACGAPPEPPRPSVLLVSLDTLRADHLVPYGYERATSPALARFASQAVRFDQAHAHSTATLPSHLSLLTAILPPELAITRSEGRHTSQRTTRLRIPDGVTTLAEVFRDVGYRTAAFTDGGYVIPYYGMGQGFEQFSVTSAQEGAYWNGLRKSIPKLVTWLDSLPEDAPFFVFLHTYDVHEPYSPPKPFERSFTDTDYRSFKQERGFEARPVELSGKRDELTAQDLERAVGFYDNGVLATDKAMGRLFAILKKRGLYDRSLIVVLSDHGEEFLDHGDFGHGPSVYQELTRVPLLVRLPGGAGGGRVIEHPVGLVEVAPTIVDLAGIVRPPRFGGRSLAAMIEGRDKGDWLVGRPIYMDVPDVTKRVRGLRQGRWKLVRRGDRSELYDLASDPGEKRDLAAEEPARLRDMESLLERWRGELRESGEKWGTRAVPATEPHPLEQEAALRALGYVE